jgi:hypothetical protein
VAAMRNVTVLQIYQLQKGIIASLRFLDKVPPNLGDIFSLDGKEYVIKGVNYTPSFKNIPENLDNSIYQCIIEEV